MPLLENIPSGWPGTARTIAHMRNLAIRDARNWSFIKIISRITQGCPHKDQRCKAEKIFRFVKRYVEFTLDPITANGHGLELVQAPMRTLERRQGDCDDFSTLVVSAAMSQGIPAKFVTIKADRRRPTEFSHVYPIVKIGNRWIGADPTVSYATLGWEPQIQTGRQEWGV